MTRKHIQLHIFCTGTKKNVSSYTQANKVYTDLTAPEELSDQGILLFAMTQKVTLGCNELKRTTTD